MNRALQNEVADLLSIVGERFLRIAQLMRSGSENAGETGAAMNDGDRARAVSALLSLDDKTPEEIETLKRMRNGKPNGGNRT